MKGNTEHWLKDSASEVCMDCGAKFTFFKRRHHVPARAVRGLPARAVPCKLCGTRACSAGSAGSCSAPAAVRRPPSASARHARRAESPKNRRVCVAPAVVVRKRRSHTAGNTLRCRCSRRRCCARCVHCCAAWVCPPMSCAVQASAQLQRTDRLLLQPQPQHPERAMYGGLSVSLPSRSLARCHWDRMGCASGRELGRSARGDTGPSGRAARASAGSQC